MAIFRQLGTPKDNTAARGTVFSAWLQKRRRLPHKSSEVTTSKILPSAQRHLIKKVSIPASCSQTRHLGPDMSCRLTLVAVLLALSSLMAQSNPDQSGIASKAHSKNSKRDVTVQGCVAMSFGGSYVLMQTDPGNTYELEKGSRKIKLGPHLGEYVEVTGWERPSLNTSSDALTRIGPASPVTIMVTSIRTIARRCTATGEASASPVAALYSELRISSTPTDADIEIDGNFVGNTPSTVGVTAGQHQLAVKKSSYKSWEKKITVSSGQVRVDAVLEAESK